MDDAKLIEEIRNGHTTAFETVFRNWYEPLCRYAFSLLKDETQAEEFVQEVFVKLWEKRLQLSIQTSLKAYLYRSVHNRCLNWIDHQKVKGHYREDWKLQFDEAQMPQENAEHRQLLHQFSQALQRLPGECRRIFQLSREAGFSYREIAETLDISIKTVENQMGKALKILRSELRDYLPVLAGLAAGALQFLRPGIGVIFMLTVLM
jgi:RNA polymerase sigma-70 factor (family 1)